MVTAREVAKWNTRVSLVYAIGIWTMLGSFGYFQVKRKRENLEAEPDAVEAQGKTGALGNDLPFQPTPEEKRTGFYMSQTVTYKENFVPYSTRIYNFISSHLSSTSDAATKSDTSEK
ncbi:small integral membrane protein 26 [Microcaecilia unicolor]|uniref:Small integral membrane protein 26 n=1 Tax=Microcaecilia unicolor TaxID=1415580 RepID=A0A6P7XNU8_9AMPH|nr:small integral membrane protein 26 [Microcaecilia unicolor]